MGKVLVFGLLHYWVYWNSLELKDGLVCRRYYRQDGLGSYLQFIVPKALLDEVLRMIHNCALAGHLGYKKTTQKLLQQFYWHQVRKDVRLWVAQCDICQSTKPSTKKSKAPLGRMTAGAPLDQLCTDIIGPLPTTPRGNKFILVVTDSFRK